MMSDERLEFLVQAARLAAPDASSDPTAAALGLVPNGALLDPKLVAAKRKSLGAKNSELAEMLAARGWRVTGAEVLSWQTGDRTFVAPALARALATVLLCDEGDLQLTDSALSKTEAALVGAPKFGQLVERLRSALHMTNGGAEAMLLSKYRGLAYRGGEPDVEHGIDALEAYVGALESKANCDHG